MKILVCISNVPDTTTKIKLNPNKKKIDYEGVQWIINPWDELALTRAIELKEDTTTNVSEVDVVHIGTAIADSVLRKCLAIGADKAFRINIEAINANFTAIQLSNFIKNSDYDLIICGSESSDYNGSSVGIMLADRLSIPLIISTSNIDINDNIIKVNTETEKETLVLQLEKLPALLVIQKGFAKEPKIPNLKGIIQARRKPLEVIEPINVDTQLEYTDYYYPTLKGKVKLIDEDNLQELVNLLSTEAKVL